MPKSTRVSSLDSLHQVAGLFFDLSNEMLCVANRDGYFTNINLAWTTLLGWSPQEMTETPYLDFVHPDDRDATIAEAGRLYSENYETVRFENRYRHKDGSYRWLAWLVKRDPASDTLVAAARDVTETRQQAESLRMQADTIRHLFSLQDQERKLISHDIHDGLAQLIIGASMQVEAAIENEAQLTPQLHLAQDILHKAITESRRLINDLRPMIIDERGIRDSIKYLIAEQAKTSTCQIDCAFDLQQDHYEPLFDGVVFRIVQESISNAIRHGQASLIFIRVRQVGKHLRLEIRDNGCGFDPKRIPTGRLGVRGIRERAKIFHGQAWILSKPGNGTRIKVRLSIPGWLESK